MALDGIFLNALKTEILEKAEGAKVDKIFQPFRHEIHMILRDKGESIRLCLSAAADSPRIHFTEIKPENPAAAPMFCMLLRKHLAGGKLLSAEQPSLERVIILNFQCFDELGDKIVKSLVLEVMGKHSNIILLNEKKHIVDAVKRVDFSMSRLRQIGPGLDYKPPPAQNKLSLLDNSPDDIAAKIAENPSLKLEKAMLKIMQGISPAVARELSHRCCGHTEISVGELDALNWQRLISVIGALKKTVLEKQFVFAIYRDVASKKIIEYSFLPLSQYGSLANACKFDSPSVLLDEYHTVKAKKETYINGLSDIKKLIKSSVERISKKLELQRRELAECEKKDVYRLYGDIVTANIYKIKRGDLHVIAQDFSQKNPSKIKIPLNPTLAPSANAQKYYKKYAKLKTALKALTHQISLGLDELLYLESVLDNLERVGSASELSEIKEELWKSGYLKQRKKNKNTAHTALPVKSYISSDGFTILVGRNNLQNDRLTLKIAKKHDLWLHVKDQAGSHVVVETKGQAVPQTTVTEAAQLAALNSKAFMSTNVPVDCTFIKNVRKPSGAKPGMVIYDGHRTLFVKPQNPFEVKK